MTTEESNQSTSTETPAQPATSSSSTSSSERTFTQSELNEIIRGRVGEATRKAQEDLAKNIGVSVEEAKQIITEARNRDEANKTEAEKLRTAAEREKAEAEAAKREAQQARHDALVERHLTRVLKEEDDAKLDAKIGRLRKLLDVEVGADSDAITAAIKTLQKEWPELFGTTSSPPKGLPNGDPKGGPPGSKATEDAFSRGLERAKKRGAGESYPIMQQK